LNYTRVGADSSVCLEAALRRSLSMGWLP